jgi:hypothetical protein
VSAVRSSFIWIARILVSICAPAGAVEMINAIATANSVLVFVMRES